MWCTRSPSPRPSASWSRSNRAPQRHIKTNAPARCRHPVARAGSRPVAAKPGLPRPATVRPTPSVQKRRGVSPLSGPLALVHDGWMSMYVELLSAALARDDRVQMNVEDVHASAVTCRYRMHASRMRADRSAERELATEVDYDCSLINLCRALGIPADSTRFAQPAPERARLEQALDEAGEDLTSSGGSRSDRTS